MVTKNVFRIFISTWLITEIDFNEFELVYLKCQDGSLLYLLNLFFKRAPISTTFMRTGACGLRNENSHQKPVFINMRYMMMGKSVPITQTEIIKAGVLMCNTFCKTLRVMLMTMICMR